MATHEKPAGMVITVGGLHGTGKSTYAKALSRIFGLRHVSAGKLFRRIARERGLTLQDLGCLAGKDRQIDEFVDDMIKKEAERGSVVIDGLLAAWMAGEKAQIKIYLFAPDEVRFKRIASRDGLTYEAAKQLTLGREGVERERYRKFYELDIDDLTFYDIVLNTGVSPFNLNVKAVTKVIDEYMKNKVGR